MFSRTVYIFVLQDATIATKWLLSSYPVTVSVETVFDRQP